MTNRYAVTLSRNPDGKPTYHFGGTVKMNERDTDYFTPILIILGCTALMFFVLGLNIGTSTARRETEEQTVVYCIEKPKDCKTKYDFYKLENQK